MSGMEALINAPWLLTLLIIIGLWDLLWKGIALWKCGINKQLGWFIPILIVNSIGILPIVYLVFFQKGVEKAAPPNKISAPARKKRGPKRR